MCKSKIETPHLRTTFGSWDVKKVHAAVARSTFTKSKCTRYTRFGPLLKVAMSKKCTPLWREAHLPSQNVQDTPGSDHFWKLRCRKSARRCGAKHETKSKMYKTHQVRTTFGSWDVEKVYAVVARSTFPSQTCKNLMGSDHFWTFRCRKSAHWLT